MLRNRGPRRALAVGAIAAAATIATVAPAGAQPIALPEGPAVDQLQQILDPAAPGEGVPVPADLSIEALTELLNGQNLPPQEFDALAALAPAIIGAATTDAASPTGDLLAQARDLLENSQLPDNVKALLLRVITFLDGSGGGGPDIPDPDTITISQFLYPTLGRGCIGDGQDSVGTALAVPGPAHLPPPGPGAGQAGFVFTALGTQPLAPTQAEPLTVNWVNVSNGRTGSVPLTGEARINPDGPATLSAIADTGAGNVVAVISGGITSNPEQPRSCTFLPTIGLVSVR